MPSPNKKVVKSYLERNEYEELLKLAKQSGLSVSTFIKNVCLNKKIRTTTDYKTYLLLLKANADLGRVGGLLKLAITNGDQEAQSVKNIRTLLREIERNQNILMKYSKTITDSFVKREKC